MPMFGEQIPMFLVTFPGIVIIFLYFLVLVNGMHYVPTLRALSE